MDRQNLIRLKKSHKKWVMVTAYDTPTAEILDSQGVDFVLVGDSLGMVVLGYPSTALVTMDEMIHHARAVRRGVKRAKLICDLPLKGVQKGPRQALESARRFLGEAGCDGVKLEWGKRAPETMALFKKHRIPVMGHAGLTPQTASGFKVHGKSASEALKVLKEAEFFEKAGAFSVLLECIPAEIAKTITQRLQVPTIGIGAGPDCDGQVLVFHDLAGIFTQFQPRHVKRYAQGRRMLEAAVAGFSADVRRRRFPQARHSFGIDAAELKVFKTSVGKTR